MTKRYFTRNWGDEYYIFDSEVISEEEFDRKVQYEDYHAFEDSLTPKEIVELLNDLYDENRELKEECRHQQRQKIRLCNYLKQYMDIEKIRSILNKE